MNCIAITHGGFGHVFKFETREAAYEHPVVQFGDALLSGVDDLLEEYNRLEWANLAKLVEITLPTNVTEVLRGQDIKVARKAMQESAGEIFKKLERAAKNPPEKLSDIVAIVASSRKGVRKMTEAASAAPKEAKTPKEPKAPKVKAEKVAAAPREGDLPLEAKITIAHDKDGKVFSAQNLPMREGSNRAQRFLTYKNGMTVQHALDAGLTMRHVKQSVELGHIKVG